MADNFIFPTGSLSKKRSGRSNVSTPVETGYYRNVLMRDQNLIKKRKSDGNMSRIMCGSLISGDEFPRSGDPGCFTGL